MAKLPWSIEGRIFLLFFLPPLWNMEATATSSNTPCLTGNCIVSGLVQKRSGAGKVPIMCIHERKSLSALTHSARVKDSFLKRMACCQVSDFCPCTPTIVNWNSLLRTVRNKIPARVSIWRLCPYKWLHYLLQND